MFRVVYVLCCNELGHYPEQCLMSLYTLRKHNPDIRAFVIIDRDTHDCLKGKRLDALARYAEILIFDVPAEYNTEKLRSRYLKTSVRNYISGDFVFLDCDTIVCRPFSTTDFKDVIIGMVADLNGTLLLSDENTLRTCRNAGFPSCLGLPYFNSGVIFVKDAPVSFRLFETWHKLWRESVQNGCVSDQPALCEANRILGGVITELHGRWNCQFKAQTGAAFIPKAIILHYFSPTSSEATPFQINELFLRISRTGTIDPVVGSILSGKPEHLAIFWEQKTDSALRFLGSPMFRVFVEDSPVYRFSSRFADFIYRWKHSLRNLFHSSK